MIVTETGAGGFTRHIAAGHHQLTANEPLRSAATLGHTLRSTPLRARCVYLDDGADVRRPQGRPVEDIRVTLRHSRIHAKDCGECETKIGFINQIDCDVEVTGDLDDDQRERLRYIAERRPVHQTLTSEIHISTTLS